LKQVGGLKEVVAGDGRNLPDMKKAVSGRNAVIAIVGVRSLKQNSTVSDVMRILLQAMQEEGVRRLVCVSSYLLVATRPRVITPLFQWLLRHPFADRSAADQLVKSSQTDWTIVRPGRLLDQPATGSVRLQRHGKPFETGPYMICRADLTAVLLDIAESKEANKSVINVAWGKRK
jgi:putative NADH-flavin reductase